LGEELVDLLDVGSGGHADGGREDDAIHPRGLDALIQPRRRVLIVAAHVDAGLVRVGHEREQLAGGEGGAEEILRRPCRGAASMMRGGAHPDRLTTLGAGLEVLRIALFGGGALPTEGDGEIVHAGLDGPRRVPGRDAGRGFSGSTRNIPGSEGGTVYLWGPSWKAPRVASGTPFVRIRSSRRAGSVHPSPAAPPDATTAPRSKVTPWLFEEELHVAPVAGLQSPSGHRAGGAGPHAGQPERRRTCHRAFGTPRTVPGPMGRLAGGRLPDALRSPSGSGEPARRAALRPAVPLQLGGEPLLRGLQQRRSLAPLPLPAGSHPPAEPGLRGLPAGEPALCRQGGGALPAGGHHLGARLPADAGAPDAARAAPRGA